MKKHNQNAAYQKLLRELKNILSTDQFIQHILNTLIIFTFVFLITYSLNLFPLYIAGTASLLYFAARLFFIRSDLSKLEEKHPELSDQVQTFKDTLDEDNYIIGKLREDLIRKVKYVANGEFINFKRLYYKSIVLVLFAFAIVTFASFNIQFDLVNYFHEVDVGDVIGKITLSDNAFDDVSIIGEATAYNKNTGQVADLLEREEELSIKYETELDFNNLFDPEEKEMKEDSSVPVIRTTADDIYVEPINEEEKEIIKRYLQKITEKR